jgi:CHAT domain-containing protein
VLAESGGADLLHLACHAWFDPQVPLSSGLVLSQSRTDAGGDNGLLQAWEVFQSLRLSADLVVLSACQTGLGKEVRGEGLVGLARAFQYAGARSLVVTLWDVADESTSLFMQAFYAALKDGAAKDDALRRGVLALQADPRWDAPCYWAAFVLIGDRN